MFTFSPHLFESERHPSDMEQVGTSGSGADRKDGYHYILVYHSN